jgi:GNAT superfamily N-acetyltransferase
MAIEIKEVRTKKALRAFIKLPFLLYSNNKCWIPPLVEHEFATLEEKKNPAFDYCEAKYWLAFKDGKPVGRITGIINLAFNEKWKRNYARFGWIDFIDDDKVSKALINTVEAWAIGKGLKAVHGPLGFTDLDFEGMLVDGFDEIGTMSTIYNFPYYPLHLAKHGYAPDVTWLEYELKLPPAVPERLEKLASVIGMRYNLTIVRPKKRKEILPYARDIFALINEAYKDLYGVVTLTEKQIEYYVKLYFGFIRADFVTIVKDRQGKLIAFGITMPSLALALQKANGYLFPFGFIHLLKAMKRNNRADLLLVAIRPDYQNKGINALLMREMAHVYISNGISVAESNPELESNEKVQAFWKHFERRQHKKRSCFIKQLS